MNHLPDDVTRIYESVGIELPGLVVRRLEEVEIFHRRLIENRRDFLSTEIARIRRDDIIKRTSHT